MKKGTGLGCVAAMVLSGVLAASPASKPTPRPKARPRAASAPVLLRPPEALSAGEPISLDLKDADIRDVIRTFGALARFNVVVDPEVHGSVTIRLHDVPWDQALEVILRSNGLGSVLEGNVLRIGVPAMLADR
jgi:type II secretory pathway component HofQ